MRALAISGGILIAVFILIVIVSMVAVKRGEIEMDTQNKRSHGH
jgi:hypothetical protein